MWLTNRLDMRSIARCRAGNIAITLALAMPVLIGAVGLGVDVSYNYATSQKMQTAADFAALSAATAYSKSSSANLVQEASFITSQYGFGTANGASTSVNKPPLGGSHAGVSGYIEVTISQPQSIFFAQIFGLSAKNIVARAVSVISSKPACVLALNNTANKSLNVSGGIVLNTPNCNIAVNSTSSSAINASGGATITASSVQTAGGETLSGGASINVTGTNQSYASAVADPFASVAVPSFSGCDKTNYSTSVSATLNPGVYCGGLTVSSAPVTLNPGVYFIDRGSLTVSGSGSLTGTGVTIVFVSSTGSGYGGLAFSGSSTVTLSAPTSGATAGLALFGDRSMPITTKFDFSGGTNQSITGAAYLPRGQVVWSGSSTATSQCTQLVGDTINFSGSAAFEPNCSAYGGNLGSPSSKLIE